VSRRAALAVGAFLVAAWLLGLGTLLPSSNRWFLVLLAPALLLTFLSSNAQVIQEVQNSFNLYKQSALQEKVFVHTDKTTYLPGEIVWFKVFCVDGNDHKPLNLSKVVYVEILDNNQSPVTQAKIAMKNGIGDGSLYIPVSVKFGKIFSPPYAVQQYLLMIN